MVKGIDAFFLGDFFFECLLFGYSGLVVRVWNADSLFSSR